MSLTLKIVFTILILVFGIYSNARAFQYSNIAYDHREVPDSLNSFMSTATKYYYEEDCDKAIIFFEKLVNSIFKLNYDKYAVDSYEYLIDCIANNNNITFRNKISQIIEYCDKEDRVNLSPVKYSYLAQCYLMEDILDTAQYYYDLSTKHCHDNKMFLVETNLNIGFSFIYYNNNNLKQTLLYTKKAEAIAQEKLRPLNIDFPSNLFNIQSSVYKSLGYIEKAINSDLDMIRIIKKDPSISPSILGDQYRGVAIQFDELGDLDNARIYYNKSIENYTKYAKNKISEIIYIRYCIATLYEDQGKVALAKEKYKTILKDIKEKKIEKYSVESTLVQTYQRLSFIYLQNNQKDSFLYCLNHLNTLNRTFSFKEEVTYNINGKYHSSLKEYAKAEAFFHKAIKSISNKTNTDVQQHTCAFNEGLSNIYLQRGLPKKALTYCQQSLTIIAPSFSKEEQYANPSFNKVAHKHTLILPLKNKLKVLEALYQQKDPQVTPQLLLSTIKLVIQALEYKNKSFKSKSSQTYWLNQEAIPLFEKAIKIALHLQERTGDAQYLDEAFMLSERSKSMMMMNALQEQNATSFGGIPKELIKQEQELELELEVAEKLARDAAMANDSVELQYQDSLIFVSHHAKIKLLQQFESNYPKYYELKYQVYKTSIQEVQEALDEQTVLIEYFQGQDRIYIFTLTKSTAFVRSFEHTKLYDIQLDSFQSLLVDLKHVQEDFTATYQQFISSSYELYQLLLAESLVPNKQRIMLIPDGKLAYLPFEVLLTKHLANTTNNQQKILNFANLPYLLRQYTTNYNYSAQLFLEQRKRRVAEKKSTILGLAPYYNNKKAPEWRNPYEQKLRQELPKLSGTVKELEFLEQSLRLKGRYLYGAAASETRFKAQAASFDILHLAVHGLVDQERPELSGLALEEDNSRKEDNILYAYEIKQLELNARLVVLSACETGVGKYQRGEGVMSIGRGFMYAGVPSLMTTLWNLNDHSGLIIIEKFYENLDAGMAKDEALRQAKLYYLDNIRGTRLITYPALWACFVQVGDYTPLVIKHNYQQWYLLGAGLLVALLVLRFLIIKRKK